VASIIRSEAFIYLFFIARWLFFTVHEVVNNALVAALFEIRFLSWSDADRARLGVCMQPWREEEMNALAIQGPMVLLGDRPAAAQQLLFFYFLDDEQSNAVIFDLSPPVIGTCLSLSNKHPSNLALILS
jgi:hypothetical protein